MNSEREIVYLSPPAAVSMANRWYGVASVNHFWMRRRFEVMQRMAGHLLAEAREMAEIGCGGGLLQRQIEDGHGRKVTGFDLNEYALKQSVSRLSEVCCYDIHQKNSALRGKFDVIFLFDVLEHIADEDRFLQSVTHHLAPDGKLIVNVPGGKWAYSAYDRAAGHIRRYSYSSLRNSIQRNGLEITNWTYWGFPLLPLVILRKAWLSGQTDENTIIATGFDSRSEVMNKALALLSECEFIPQHSAGSSLMAIVQLNHTAR